MLLAAAAAMHCAVGKSRASSYPLLRGRGFRQLATAAAVVYKSLQYTVQKPPVCNQNETGTVARLLCGSAIPWLWILFRVAVIGMCPG